MNIGAKEIELIVQQVLENIDVKALSAPKASAGEDGVFDCVEEAIEAAYQAQRRWVRDYNLEDRKRVIAAIRAVSGDEGLMIEECAPFGVIGAITPSTNPTETIINNTISMIAGGNILQS